MMLHSFIHKIYCCTPWQLTIIAVAATGAYAFCCRKFGNRKMFKYISLFLFALWIAGVITATLLGRQSYSYENGFSHVFASYQMVLQGGNPEILRCNFMNMLLFYPGGVLLSVIYAEHRKLKGNHIAIICCSFSFLIELIQYILGLGYGEIDDVLHNTVGALLGTIVLKASKIILQR